MEGIELTAFSIISNVGMAKSLAIEALRDARKGKYNEAEKKMAEVFGNVEIVTKDKGYYILRSVKEAE